MVSRYRSVVAVPGCVRVFGTALLARLSQGMSSLAILLLVRGATHSYPAAGAAVGGYALACAAAVPIQGRLVDRLGRLAVLVPAALIQAVALVGLVLAAHAGAPAPVLVALAIVAGAMQPAIAPTVRALLRDMLRDPRVRETGYALESVMQELIWICGPLIVAAAITVISPSGAVLASGAICLVGTSLFVASPRVRSGGRRGPVARARGTVITPELQAMLGPIALMGMSIGVIDIGIPALALHDGSRASAGLLLSLWSVGSLLGGLWHGGVSWRHSVQARYRWLLVGTVLSIAPLIVARSIPEAMAASLLAGITIAPTFSCQYALVGRTVAPGTETEAFTWVAAALMGGLAAGSTLGGVLVGALGVSASFVVACAAMGISAVAAIRLRVPDEVVAS